MSKRPLVSYHAILQKDFRTLNKGCTVDPKYIIVLAIRGGGGVLNKRQHPARISVDKTISSSRKAKL